MNKESSLYNQSLKSINQFFKKLILNTSVNQPFIEVKKSFQAYFTIDSRSLASKHKRSARDKKLLYGIKQFNLEPRRGIKFLMEADFLDSKSAKSVAQFLFR